MGYDRRERKEVEWIPKTELGKKVKAGEVTDINTVLDKHIPIREQQITELLIPNLTVDFILVGQAKGKFGGGQRRIFRVSQKKTSEGNRPTFLTFAVVGNNDGIVGFGVGRAAETVPARNKAVENAKKNLLKIKRGCGSWECGCGEPHSIPYSVTGRCSSVTITLYPAPKGIGLCVTDECKKILKLAGIKDVWSRTTGKTSSRMNLIKALFDALKNLSKYHVQEKYASKIVDGVKR
ncbi:30S ribosomal protein S5 [Candidatus Tiddalikarchaeum anstoanum]|nr:30S ribosomal protein S5 [Candidatus Tiddalikarchaeum anstoanum]